MSFVKKKFECLPCGELICSGVDDLLSEKITIGACLVAIALPQMKALGIIPKNFQTTLKEGELTLYRLLRLQPGDAYSRYNAFLRELASFLRCAACSF